MDDRYCPTCRQIYSCRGGQAAPTHCRACLGRRRIIVALLALDQLPPATVGPGPLTLVGTAGRGRVRVSGSGLGGVAAHE
jgi:hypothetical protein